MCSSDLIHSEHTCQRFWPGIGKPSNPRLCSMTGCTTFQCIVLGSGRYIVPVMTRPRSPKTVFICVSVCVFGIGDFAGSSMRKVSLFQLFAKSPLLVCYISNGSICNLLFNKIAIERFYLSRFIFIIYSWTMIFLCIFLLCSL